MLQALLLGKLSPEQENSEDLLTSAVFGLLRHLPPSDGLFQLLNLSEPDEEALGRCVPHGCSELTDMQFWPTYSDKVSGSTEPDVIVWARDADGGKHIFLIEVKLWSGKSSLPSPDPKILGDQLAREWWTLLSLCKRDGASPHLVYVTADLRRPLVDLREAKEEYSTKLPEWGISRPFVCYWLPWSKIVVSFENSSSAALREIALACRKLDLDPFVGVHPIEQGPLEWAYSAGTQAYSFGLNPSDREWRFK